MLTNSGVVFSQYHMVEKQYSLSRLRYKMFIAPFLVLLPVLISLLDITAAFSPVSAF
jgi:hypothetical protein